MAKVRLTDKYVAAITAPAGKRLEVFDQHPHGAGLMLRVTDAGLKTWMVRYRTDDGQHRRLSLGLYPDIDLAEARDRAGAARKASRDGLDPAGEKKRKRAEVRAQPIKTFCDLSDAYFTASEIGEWKPRGKKKRASTLAEEKGLWNRHIKSALGDLRVEDVTPAAVRKLLRELVARGHGVTSNRVRSQIRQMFNFALSDGRLQSNPVALVPPLGAESPRDRVLRDEELKALWAALTSPEGLTILPKGEVEPVKLYVGEPVRIAIKVLALTLTRRAEVAGMARAELDLAQGVWTIPADRSKNGRAHLVPLGKLATDLIKRAIEIADDGRETKSPYVFPSPRDLSKPIGAGAISHALRDIKLALGASDLRAHDLRRTGATLLASERIGVSPFLIGRLLNHTTETGGAALVTLSTYALHDFVREKRTALDAWEALLLEIVGTRRRNNNVQPLRPSHG